MVLTSKPVHLENSTFFFILACQGALAHFKLLYLWLVQDSSIPPRHLKNYAKGWVTLTTQEAFYSSKALEIGRTVIITFLQGTPGLTIINYSSKHLLEVLKQVIIYWEEKIMPNKTKQVTHSIVQFSGRREAEYPWISSCFAELPYSRALSQIICYHTRVRISKNFIY